MQNLTETNVNRLLPHLKINRLTQQKTLTTKRKKKFNYLKFKPKMNPPQEKTEKLFTQKKEQTNITNGHAQLY